MTYLRLASLFLCLGVWGMLASSAWANGTQVEFKLPAAEIAKAITTAEESDPNAEYPDTGFVDWDPYIDPNFSRSWLYLEVPPEVLDKLELNQDQHGRPLFLSTSQHASSKRQ